MSDAMEGAYDAYGHRYRDFDDVLVVVGGFGKFQKLALFFIVVPLLLPVGFFNFNIVFMAATPDPYGCALPIANFTAADLAIFAPKEERNGKLEPSRCLMYNLTYDLFTRKTLQDAVNKSSGSFSTVPCKYGWVYTDEVYLSTVVTEWCLVCDREWLASMAFASATIGTMFGTLFWAFVADRYGRKPALLAMIIFQLTFGVAAAFAPNLISFFIFRFCSGTGTEFLYTALVMISLELTGPATRSFISVVCALAYTASVLMVIGIAYFIRTWHGLALASSAPLFALVLLWPFLPESPRWLLAQKRYKDLEKYLKRIARINGKDLDAKFKADLPEILQQIDEEDHIEKTSIIDLFRTPNMRKKTLILSFISFCNLGLFYGLNLFEPAFGSEPHYNSILVNLVELPPLLFAKFLCDRLGRRLSLFYFMVLCSICCLTTYFVPESQDKVILALSLSAKLCITLTFLVGILFEEELFPTVVRGQGHSFTIVVAQIAGISIPFVVALGSTYAVLPLIIFGCLCCLASVTVLFLPETTGTDLPQTLHDGERFGADMTWKTVGAVCPVRMRKSARESANGVKMGERNGDADEHRQLSQGL